MKVIVDNLAIEYADEGAGFPLLFIHGWGDSLHTFDALTLELKRKYRIVRLDLPGFGGSEIPTEPWDVEHYARLVQSFLQKVNVQPAAIVGHSLGGRIAIKGAATGVLQPSRLILIASAGNARRRTLRNAIYFVLAKIGKALTAIWPFSYLRAGMRRRLYESIESDYPDTAAMKDTFLRVIREDLTADAVAIRQSVQLIWGDHDRTTPLSDGVRFETVIPHAKLEVIPDSGHFVHRERPQAVAAKIEQFV